MWAPADIFTRTVSAIGLALKRLTTALWDNLLYVSIAVCVLIALLVVINQFRKPRGD